MSGSTHSPHWERVAQFMILAGQFDYLLSPAPESTSEAIARMHTAVPQRPPRKTAELRASLVFEETRELLQALGVDATVGFFDDAGHYVTRSLFHVDLDVETTEQYFEQNFDLIDVADGCADVSVVVTGTLVACGIPDVHLLEVVDKNNLDKFGPGHSLREDGKLIKPPGHQPPDIGSVLIAAGWAGRPV